MYCDIAILDGGFEVRSVLLEMEKSSEISIQQLGLVYKQYEVH